MTSDLNVLLYVQSSCFQKVSRSNSETVLLYLINEWDITQLRDMPDKLTLKKMNYVWFGRQPGSTAATTPQQTHVQHQLSQHNPFVLHVSYIGGLLMFEWTFSRPPTDISASFGNIVRS